MDIVQTFLGVLILSFVIERIFEIFSSCVDFLCCSTAVDDKQKTKISLPIIDKEKSKGLDTTKRLIFTIAGFFIALGLISLLWPHGSLLYSAGYTDEKYHNWDWFLTAIAISGGTAFIHSFFDSLQKYGKSGS